MSVELREQNPLFDGTTDSAAEIYYPIILVSKWMPSEATYDEERFIGMSLLSKSPVGTPKPHQLKPWASQYRKFMNCMRKEFPRESEKYIFQAWERFLLEEMPLVPGISPPQPSDDIYDFVVAKGSDFQPPLGEFIYGTRPLGFWHLHEGGKNVTITPTEPSTLNTAFTGTYAGKEVSVLVYVSISSI